MVDKSNGDLRPEGSFGTSVPLDLPFKTLVKKHSNGVYYDFVGKVEVLRNEDNSIDCVSILDIETGKERGYITRHVKDFLPYEGKIIRFRGIYDEKWGRILPHIKKD